MIEGGAEAHIGSDVARMDQIGGDVTTAWGVRGGNSVRQRRKRDKAQFQFVRLRHSLRLWSSCGRCGRGGHKIYILEKGDVK